MGSESEYHTFMQNVGFSEIEFEELSQSFKKTWAIYTRRLIDAFFTDRKLRQFILNTKSV